MASVNDDDVKVVEVRGEFVWHQHDQTDEFFLVRPASSGSAWRVAMTSSWAPGSCSWSRGGAAPQVADQETHLLLLDGDRGATSNTPARWS